MIDVKPPLHLRPDVHHLDEDIAHEAGTGLPLNWYWGIHQFHAESGMEYRVFYGYAPNDADSDGELELSGTPAARPSQTWYQKEDEEGRTIFEASYNIEAIQKSLPTENLEESENVQGGCVLQLRALPWKPWVGLVNSGPRVRKSQKAN